MPSYKEALFKIVELENEIKKLKKKLEEADLVSKKDVKILMDRVENVTKLINEVTDYKEPIGRKRIGLC